LTRNARRKHVDENRKLNKAFRFCGQRLHPGRPTPRYPFPLIPKRLTVTSWKDFCIPFLTPNRAASSAAMSAQANLTSSECISSGSNATASSSFQDFVTTAVFSFAPVLNTLPDWLKLAIIGTVFETARRYLTGWYYSAKNAMFMTIVFNSQDPSFRESYMSSRPYLCHWLMSDHI
jgi:hypothetical protein